jgi:hypothetical protein
MSNRGQTQALLTVLVSVLGCGTSANPYVTHSFHLRRSMQGASELAIARHEDRGIEFNAHSLGFQANRVSSQADNLFIWSTAEDVRGEDVAIGSPRGPRAKGSIKFERGQFGPTVTIDLLVPYFRDGTGEFVKYGHNGTHNVTIVRADTGVVGLEIAKDQDSDTALVVRAFPPYDAHKKGIQPGDRIVAIDNVQTKNQALKDVADRLSGPVGTTVLVTVLRLGTDRPINFELTRLPRN